MRYDTEIVSVLGELPMQLKSNIVQDYEIIRSVKSRINEEDFEPDKLDIETFLHAIIRNIILPLKDLQSIYGKLNLISTEFNLKGYEFTDLSYKFDKKENVELENIVSAFEKLLHKFGDEIMDEYSD